MDSSLIALAAITFVAAMVNGALGYGFSSVAVPLALLFVGNRELNPAIVSLEVFMNAYVLWVNRGVVRDAWRRAAFITLGLPAGILLGTNALTHVDPAWLKLCTFGTLLPLILLQAAGFRRALRFERSAGAAFGAGVGALYAVTTISGPPLAMFLTNQGLAKEHFRAALGIIRFAASVLTATLYARASLFTDASFTLLWVILPSVLIGVPLGGALLKRIREESFRRVCMTFDAAIVAFGISTLLQSLHIVRGAVAFVPLALVIGFDAYVLLRYFRGPASALERGVLSANLPTVTP